MKQFLGVAAVCAQGTSDRTTMSILRFQVVLQRTEIVPLRILPNGYQLIIKVYAAKALFVNDYEAPCFYFFAVRFTFVENTPWQEIPSVPF